MFFSGLRKISLQTLRIVGRVWNVMSMATITIDYYKAFGLTKSPLFGVDCIDQVSSYSSISLLIEND